MTALTPLEVQAAGRLADALLRARVPVSELRVFGSRARGHSDEHSDLDLAVVVDHPPDPRLARTISDIASRLCDPDEAPSLRVQAVPLFRGEEQGFFARAIARDARTIWTRT